MIKILLGVIVATIAVVTVFLVLDPNVGISQQGTTDVTEVEKNTLSITVEGAVNKPGSYSMAENSTMSDLIDAAGGTTSSVDERAYYLDTLLVGGMSYFIASRYDASDLCSKQDLEKVNINADDAQTLTTISGITSTIANSIVTYRNDNGLFSTIEQLQEVYGIGSATYKKVRNYVILHVWVFYFCSFHFILE